MPVQFGSDATGCFARWGEAGKAYYYECDNEAAKADAEANAQQQGAAIEANATQADEDAPVETTDEPTLPKHLKIRLNDPAHFSAYQTIPYRRTPEGKDDADNDGVQVSYGVWKTTGAKVAQVYLFDTAKGWTPEKADAWMSARHIARPVQVATTQSVEDTLMDMPVTLSDADTDFRKFKVHVIREGWGKNRRLGRDGRYYQDYFSKAFLQAMLPLLEESAVQAVRIEKTDAPTGTLTPLAQETIAALRAHGHPDTIINQIHQYGFSGNTIGFLRNVNFTENAVVDEAGTPRAVDEAVFEFEDCQAAADTRRLVKSAWSKGLKKALGLSVNYRANASFSEVDGRPAFIFQTPTHHVSTELVPNPAAGGGLVAVLQSMQDNLDVKDDIQGGASATPEQPKQQAVPVTDVPSAQAETKVVTIVDEQLKKDFAATQATLAETKAAQDALKAELAAMKAAQAEREAKNALEVMVTQSDLDAESKQVLLQEVSNGGLPTEAAVKIALGVAKKAREVAVAATQAQQYREFPGMARVEVGKSPADVFSIRSKMMWDLPLTQSEQDMQKKYGIDRFIGIKDEYVALTGDDALKFQFEHDHFKQMSGAFAQSTSMTTNTYPEFLRNVISLRVERHWQEVDKSHLKVVKIGEPFSDTRPEDEYLLGKMGDISEVSEDGSYTEATAPYQQKVTSSAVKHGNILSFSEETILNDQVDLIKQTSDIFVEAMNTTLAKQVWKMLTNYGTAFNNKDVGTSASGGVLYDSTLNNVVSGNVSDIDKVRDLVDLMMTQTDIAPDGETGEPLILMPYLAVCNVKNTGTAMKILNGEYELTSTNVADALSLGFTPDRVVGIHPNYLYTKDTALFLLPDPRFFAGMELRYFRGKTSPDLIYEGNQQPAYGYAFSSDRMLLKLKMRWRLTLKRKKAFFALYA